jgi:hypothetical protein
LGVKEKMINFDSLFRVRSGFRVIAVVILIVYLLFPELSVLSLLAIVISLHQFALLFNSIGYVIPVRYLFGAFMCLQLLLGPMLAYNGLDSFQVNQYRMQIPQADYFTYVIPAVVCFILGLHLNAGKLDGELIDEERIAKYVSENKNIAYIFIAIGFVASIVAEFLSSELAFVFFLFGGFKFVGAFMIIIGNQHLRIIPLIIVYGSIIASSLGMGMFHDLLTWLVFLGCVFAIKFKPGLGLKIGAAFLFVLLALAIQQLKGDYREATWKRGEEAGLESFSKAYQQVQANNTFFSLQSLASSNLRFNQGYIVTYTMKHIPQKEPYANGSELYKIAESAILPRIIAPNKLNAGDRDFFMKYSGMRIAKGTSMGLSAVGDGYINFGVVGGCIFMFLLGRMYNFFIKSFKKYSTSFPILILFTPLVFYYPIRPDCELQTVLGHLVKSSFLIFVVFLFFKKYFITHTEYSEKNIHTNSLVPSSI